MKQTIPILVTIALFSAFTFGNLALEFSYPKNKEATFLMKTDKFKNFKKEWRGSDYYYLCDDNKEGFICSVLFYKLNKDEQKMLIDMPKQMLGSPESSPLYAQTYFTTYSNLKKFESNQTNWGELTDDFMFSQTDVKEINGIKLNQKHMYGYAMFDKDLFVNIHLSKIGCTSEDSIVMRQILEGLEKKK